MFAPVSLRTATTKFRAGQDGGVTVFVLLIFTLMVMFGGFAIDLMRYEATRVTLQNTLDRSTLAAAAMNQDLDAEDVVRDYFAKAGMSDQLDVVDVTYSETFRSVTARGKADAKPFFMHMLGIDEMDVKAISAAEQGVSNLEIILVLDVSGSMSGAKIANLRVAAAEFVETMIDNDPFGRVSIGVVPYNAQVNLGGTLLNQFDVPERNGVANIDCLELPDAAFATPGVPTDMELPMYAYADIYGGTDYVNGAVSPTGGTALPWYGYSFCRPNQENIVRLPSQDKDQIMAQIMALTAGGNTSITLGMKWGATLIDPSMQDAFEDMMDTGDMDDALEGRPYAYDDEEAQKVIVLMTDGDHVPHDRITDAYKTGDSPIWKAEDGNYSVYHEGRPANADFYVPHLGAWAPVAYKSGSPDPQQQDWREIWANLKLTYVAWQFYGRALGDGNWTNIVNEFYDAYYSMSGTWKSAAAMDTQLQATCNQVKEQDVTVYGIAFQAPANGALQIQNCASSTEAHYYAALAPEDIQTVFRSIATNLTQLRLTQ